MLKGDLVTTPLPEVLAQLADGAATGCLHVTDGLDDTAKLYLRGGRLYAVTVPGDRPQLGARLVSSGSLGPEALAEALEAQRTELQGWRLGELLVHLGYVDQPVVEAFVSEQVRESVSDLLRWPVGTWKFRVNERTREDVAPPSEIAALLTEIAHRQATWQRISDTVHGPDAVPSLSTAGAGDAEFAIDPEAWSLLCKVDGVRSVAQLASECGFTLYEAGQVVFSLVQAGLLDVEEVVAAEAPEPAGSVTSRLFAAFAPTDDEPLDDGWVEGSIDRVSVSLSAALGPVADDALFAPRPRRLPQPPTAEELERAARKADKAARDAVRRGRDAAELAEAQASLEAGRAAEALASQQPPDHEAVVVQLEDVRREAARRDEQAELAAAEAAAAAARVAAEAERLAEETRLAEQARLAAEAEATEHARLAEEQRLAAEAEAARLADDAARARLAQEARGRDEVDAFERGRMAEELRLAEQARIEAEQLAALKAEEAARAEQIAQADAEADEQARMLAQRAESASAFAELSATATSAPDAAPDPGPDPVPAREWDDAPMSSYGTHDTDMASLMRELSSLGLEDEPTPPPSQRPTPSPQRPAVSAAASQKKRKGLFGRG